MTDTTWSQKSFADTPYWSYYIPGYNAVVGIRNVVNLIPGDNIENKRKSLLVITGVIGGTVAAVYVAIKIKQFKMMVKK